jgi:hypothetical protein
LSFASRTEFRFGFARVFFLRAGTLRRASLPQPLFYSTVPVSNIDLVTRYFRLIADRVGEELKPEIFDNEHLKNIALEYFGWKIIWPFRSQDTNRLGKYYFDGSQYMISHINYEKFGKDISPLNPILLSLCSSFKNAEELEAAEEMIWANIESFVVSQAENERSEVLSVRRTMPDA